MAHIFILHNCGPLAERFLCSAVLGDLCITLIVAAMCTHAARHLVLVTVIEVVHNATQMTRQLLRRTVLYHLHDDVIITFSRTVVTLEFFRPDRTRHEQQQQPQGQGRAHLERNVNMIIQ